MLRYGTDSHGNEIPVWEKSVLPATFESINNTNPQVLVAILLALVGFFLLYGLEKWAGKLKVNN